MTVVQLRSLLDRLSGPCFRAVEGAAGAALTASHYELTLEHVLAKLLEDPTSDLVKLCEKFELDPQKVRAELAKDFDEMRVGATARPKMAADLVGTMEAAWLLASVDLGQGAGEDLPGKKRLGNQAENDVNALTVEVIFPLAYFLVLQQHIDGEDVEENEERGDDGVDESWGLGS